MPFGLQTAFAAARQPIDVEEIDGWLLCFRRSCSELVPASPLSDAILEHVDALAHHMAN